MDNEGSFLDQLLPVEHIFIFCFDDSEFTSRLFRYLTFRIHLLEILAEIIQNQATGNLFGSEKYYIVMNKCAFVDDCFLED